MQKTRDNKEIKEALQAIDWSRYRAVQGWASDLLEIAGQAESASIALDYLQPAILRDYFVAEAALPSLPFLLDALEQTAEKGSGRQGENGGNP